MPKTMAESLTDDILKFTQPFSPNSPAVLIPGVRKQVEQMVQRLLDAGFTIIPPGATVQDVMRPKVQGTSVRCPGCGAIDPDILFKSEFREVPQEDGKKPVLMGIAYIACAKETCHVIISAAAAPVQERGRVQ